MKKIKRLTSIMIMSAMLSSIFITSCCPTSIHAEDKEKKYIIITKSKKATKRVEKNIIM